MSIEEIKAEVIKEIESKYYLTKKIEGTPSIEPLLVMNTILNEICSFYNVNIDEVKGNNRQARLVHCRQLFFYITKSLYSGRITINLMSAFINKHHASVVHSVQKITDYIEFEKKLANEIEALINQIKDKLSGKG